MSNKYNFILTERDVSMELADLHDQTDKAFNNYDMFSCVMSIILNVSFMNLDSIFHPKILHIQLQHYPNQKF